MSEPNVVKVLEGRDTTRRALICRRNDGSFTYGQQFAEGDHWGPMGPHCGIYDSALTAETEARLRCEWLKKVFH